MVICSSMAKALAVPGVVLIEADARAGIFNAYLAADARPAHTIVPFTAPVKRATLEDVIAVLPPAEKLALDAIVAAKLF
jgi:hypothetical protein